jgi:hypothetical protein
MAYLIGREAAEAIAACNKPVRHLADHWFAFYAEGAIDRILLHYPMPVSAAQFDSRGHQGNSNDHPDTAACPANQESEARTTPDGEHRYC